MGIRLLLDKGGEPQDRFDFGIRDPLCLRIGQMFLQARCTVDCERGAYGYQRRKLVGTTGSTASAYLR